MKYYSREKDCGLTYIDHESMKGDRCLYCRGYADQVDHYPPIVEARFFIHWPNGFRIRACQTCNWNLSGSTQETLAERKEVALQHIPTRRIPPRFASKKDKEAYMRMERIMLSIARREPLPNSDAMLEELIKGESNDGSDKPTSS